MQLLEEEKKVLKKQNEIIEKIKGVWASLCKDSYICYSVKELAYKIVYDLLNTLYNDYTEEIPIFYKFFKGNHKIIFEIEKNIYFQFDIYWVTGMFGDSGLHIGNATLTNKLPKGYHDIESVLED